MPRSTGPRRAPTPSLRKILSVAHAAALAGGRRTLESFGKRLGSETKDDGSPVTAADRASEREIRRVIARTFPDHAVVGEELGAKDGDARVRWILDPIDGTKSFIHGVPLYSVLVGVEVDGRPSVGVIHLPALGETVEAAVGLGCRWNGRRAHVSDVSHLADATVLTTSVRALEARSGQFQRLAAATRTQRGWGDAYGFALVATGRADAMVDVGLHIWDTAPLLPILVEAGGRFTDWSSEPTILAQDAIGSNGRIHEALVQLLSDR